MSPVLLSAALAALPAAEPPLTVKDGDRVVLVGGTLIEREQRYGYWEAALTARHPDKNITFRNLGWSGDTVWGESRGSFGGPAEGLKKLKEGVRGLKPTVLIVAYGGNESFAGKDGLPRFEKGLNDLLDALTPPDCRLVLLGPPKQEDMGRPYPDPTTHNKDVALYRDKIREIAAKRKALFVDLFDLPQGVTKEGRLTDDSLHLTAGGYARTALALEGGVGWGQFDWAAEINPARRKVTMLGTTAVWVPSEPLRFKVTSDCLVAHLAKTDDPAVVPETTPYLIYHGLKDGKYTLSIDGKEVVTATAMEWDKGVWLRRGPDFDQAEKLRLAIVEKNRLYFHRWRPQNETYLFGFRKHEQGQNAREVPLFDPLVEQAEKEIAKLRVPVAHVYEIKKEAGK
jgi:lysophospholipase L1-like esterase